MKIRSGFVSNSSSSSFIIGIHCLSEKQMYQIKNHYALANKFHIKTYGDEYDEWQITEKKDYIKGYTTMDNFDMETFLSKIGVKRENIEWWHS